MSADYSSDFSRWTEETGRLLREGRWQHVDVEHLIAEVEDLGKSERRGIASQLTRLLLHLLKWQYQPQRRSDSWLDSIADARLQIELAMQDSPSLRDYPSDQLARFYALGRSGAAKQTGMPLSTFPEQCPYALDDVLSDDWLPV